MFWKTTGPTANDLLWLLHHADVSVEWMFLVLFAGLVMTWMPRRPRESRWLLLAVLIHGLSFLPAFLANWLQDASRFPMPAMQRFFVRHGSGVEFIGVLLTTILQGLVWLCLVRAAFGEKPPAPAPLPQE